MQMFTKNRDVDRLILYQLDCDRDILNACISCKYTQQICNEDFFRNLVFKKYPKSIPFKVTTWKKHYLAIVYYKEKMQELGFTFSDGNAKNYYEIMKEEEISSLVDSLRSGYLDLLRHYLEVEEIDLTFLDSRLDENMLMAIAAEHGHKGIIDYFINRGADNFNKAMAFAIRGNYSHLVPYFISKGANNWDYGLFAASEMANKEYIIYFIRKGGSKNAALRGAATGGHLMLVKFFLSEGATDINGALKYAVHHIEDHPQETTKVIKHLLSIGADVNIGLQEAHELDDPALIEYVTEYLIEIADIVRRLNL